MGTATPAVPLLLPPVGCLLRPPAVGKARLYDRGLVFDDAALGLSVLSLALHVQSLTLYEGRTRCPILFYPTPFPPWDPTPACTTA